MDSAGTIDKKDGELKSVANSGPIVIDYTKNDLQDFTVAEDLTESETTRVTCDGKTMNYRFDGGVTLSSADMCALPEGRHTIIVYTKKGNITYTLNVRGVNNEAKYVYNRNNEGPFIIETDIGAPFELMIGRVVISPSNYTVDGTGILLKKEALAMLPDGTHEIIVHTADNDQVMHSTYCTITSEGGSATIPPFVPKDAILEDGTVDVRMLCPYAARAVAIWFDNFIIKKDCSVVPYSDEAFQEVTKARTADVAFWADGDYIVIKREVLVSAGLKEGEHRLGVVADGMTKEEVKFSKLKVAAKGTGSSAGGSASGSGSNAYYDDGGSGASYPGASRNTQTHTDGSLNSHYKTHVRNHGGKFENGIYKFPMGMQPASRWVGDGSNWYFVNEDGSVKTGWICDRGLWYRLADDGKMETGWHYEEAEGKWYFLSPQNGDMLKGWQFVDGKWYYMNPESQDATYVMQDGRLVYDESKRGIQSSGAMYCDEMTPDGYKVNEKGEWVK